MVPLLFGAMAIVSGCGKGQDHASESEYAFVVAERRFDDDYARRPIDATGTVLDEASLPLSGVTATVIAWGDASENDGRSTTTDIAGRFVLTALARRSALVRISLAGHYDEIVAVDLQRPTSELSVSVPDVMLVRKRPGLVRFIFAGDTMFGRRFVDRDESGEGDEGGDDEGDGAGGDGDGGEGESEDLIRPETRAEDAKALLRFLRPLLSSSDLTQVNLETPVSANPLEVHPYKEFKFHSHPETLAALSYAGIGAVSLGNNHVYDLLESGMQETLANVAASGVDYFGAGLSETGARESFFADSLNGIDFAFQGFNGIIPFNFPPWGPDPWPDELLYNAMDGPVKGGSLRLESDNVLDFLARVPGRFAVPVFHGGFEYGEYPSTNVRARMREAIENGAGIVVAHHPHTVYGVATLAGSDPPVIVFLSLGNLVFDQDVFETFQSVVAVVDVEAEAGAPARVKRARLVPFHIEGYIPKQVSGDWAARIGRHLGHLSTYLPPAAAEGADADGLVGLVVFPAGNRIAIATSDSEYATQEVTESFLVELHAGLSAPIPYERRGDADSLARVRTSEIATVEIGRELMHYGDFEDNDADDLYHEGHLWNQSSVRFVENSIVRSGAGAFVLLRRSNDDGFVATWLRNRVTFAPDTRLTLSGWWRGRSAGRAELVARYYVRDERTVITTRVIGAREPGTYDWERFVIELAPPRVAGTVRIFFRQYPPARGEGELFLDDVALIQWEKSFASADLGADIVTPNNWSWVRVRASSDVDEIGLTLSHRTYTLARPE